MSYKYKLAAVWVLLASPFGLAFMGLGLRPHTFSELLHGISMLAVGIIIGYGERDE